LKYNTHLVTSNAAGIAIATVTPIPMTVGYLLGISIGSLLPDIDEPRSYIGRRSFGFSYIINEKFGHRGITHSLTAWIIISVLYFIYPSSFLLGLSLGYALHIFGDYFSVSSVPLYVPFNDRRRKRKYGYVTGGKVESIIYMTAWVAVILLMIVGDNMSQLFQSLIYTLEFILEQIVRVISWVYEYA
jgi:inner membrane protein